MVVSNLRGAVKKALSYVSVLALALGSTSHLHADDHSESEARSIEETIVTASYLGSSSVGNPATRRSLTAKIWRLALRSGLAML